jgi:maltose-binding protein MalE
VTAILWDYSNSYYSWGVLASAGACVFAKNGIKKVIHNRAQAVPPPVLPPESYELFGRGG